ncbi:MAG TPA: tRNA (adenosine(37)-N6)-dimethylallyltransferase MiaA [Bacteroidales bacterium]|nr:tRNA (adenosine(37)-N6)-dimethylallyltransferase MiaA [Bacteroidales bacterium]
MEGNKYNLIVVTGPTASGKTSLAAALAKGIDGEVISADSRQVYCGLDLGTGKDYDDYIVDGVSVPYHLIDIRPAGFQYNLYEYQKDFVKVFRELRQQQKWPVLCGGSGLYIEAAIQGYELVQVPVNELLRVNLEGKSLEELTVILSTYHTLHNISDVDTPKRAIRAIEIAEYYKHNTPDTRDYPEIKPLLVGVRFPRDIERERITSRLKQRLDAGMIAEVETLLKSGLTSDQLLYYGLEYKFITLYITGQLSYDEMFKLLNTAIHQFAKRQMTWFRRMERNGHQIHWLEGSMPLSQKVELILQWMEE